MMTAISLDRTPERYQQFLRWNPHIEVRRFPAIDGTALSRADCIQDRLITDDNTYVPGAIGNAASHTTLWRQCAAGVDSFHIVEDDVMLRSDFRIVADRLLRGLTDWDFVLWAHNFDWPVMVRPAGVGSVVMQYNPEEAAQSIGCFREAETSPILLPLVSAAGIGCYSLSPRGAARMLGDCLPIGAEPSSYLVRSDVSWANTGLDVEMTRHYAKWNAYVAVPPLGISPNDQSASTIRGHLAATHDPAIANRAPS